MSDSQHRKRVRPKQDSQPESVSDLLTHATTHLSKSVDLLRKAATAGIHLPRGLLHRAALWRVMLDS